MSGFRNLIILIWQHLVGLLNPNDDGVVVNTSNPLDSSKAHAIEVEFQAVFFDLYGIALLLNGQVDAGEVIASSIQLGTMAESIQMTLNPGTYHIRGYSSFLFANANYRLNVSAINTGITSGTLVDFNGDGRGDFIR